MYPSIVARYNLRSRFAQVLLTSTTSPLTNSSKEEFSKVFCSSFLILFLRQTKQYEGQLYISVGYQQSGQLILVHNNNKTNVSELFYYITLGIVLYSFVVGANDMFI